MEKVIDVRSRFADIEFDPVKHKYSYNGLDLISVTTLINKYKPVFEKERIAKKVARDRGIPKNVLLDMWNIKGTHARNVGTEFHLFVETFLKSGISIDIVTGPDNEHRVQQFDKFWHRYKETIDIVDCEVILADVEHGLAGMVDCLARNRETGRYRILDWKTNAEISEYNKYNNMLPPVQHLTECELNIYSLQLGIYTNMLKKAFPDIEVEDGALCHFPPGGDFRVIMCKGMEREVKSLLDRQVKL